MPSKNKLQCAIYDVLELLNKKYECTETDVISIGVFLVIAGSISIYERIQESEDREEISQKDFILKTFEKIINESSFQIVKKDEMIDHQLTNILQKHSKRNLER